MTDGGKTLMDLAAVGITGATLLQWLPAVAAIVTIIWTLIRIWETRTVQGWLGRKPPNNNNE